MSDTVEIIVDEQEPSDATGFVAALQAPDVFASQEIEDAFIAYIQSEIILQRDSADRQDLLDSLTKWRRQRIARPEKKTKNYPFEGAANVCPPVTAEKVNTIYSKLLSNYSTKRPFWSVDSEDATLGEVSKALEHLLNAYSKSPFHLDLANINRGMLYDLVSLGTSFYEIGWVYRQEATAVKGTTQKGAMSGFRTTKNGPVLRPVAIENFFTRPYWSDLQRAPWVAVRYPMTYAELKNAEATGEFVKDSTVSIAAGKKVLLREDERAQLESIGIQTEIDSSRDETSTYELFNFYAFWDIDGSGKLVDLHGIIEPNSGVLLRVTPSEVGWRLIGRVPYFEIPEQLYALGVGHMCEFLQDETETLHNLRLDSIKWGLLNQYKARRGSGVKSDEQAYPGKVWIVDQMDDLAPMLIPDMSESTYKAEDIARQYADHITGANAPMSGYADPVLKSGGGASAQMMMMQQSSSILNAPLDTVDTYYSEIGRLVAILIVANKDLVDLSLVTPADAELLRATLFTMTPDELPLKFKFDIQTTDQARSEDTRRQNYMNYMQLYTVFGQQTTQYYTMMAQAQSFPPLQLFAMKMVVGNTALMQAITEFFEVGSAADLLPDVTMLKNYIMQAEQQAQAQVQGGPNGGGQGTAPAAANQGGASGLAGGSAQPGNAQTAPGGATSVPV